jgi:hypothetical protein
MLAQNPRMVYSVLGVELGGEGGAHDDATLGGGGSEMGLAALATGRRDGYTGKRVSEYSGSGDRGKKGKKRLRPSRGTPQRCIQMDG